VTSPHFSLSRLMNRPSFGPNPLHTSLPAGAFGKGAFMVRSGCHHAPAAAVRTPDSRTRQVASLEPAAFTGTRPTWTDLAVASGRPTCCIRFQKSRKACIGVLIVV
jgi:hypothetical protein